MIISLEIVISFSQIFGKRSVLKDFAKSIEKHICWSLIFSKVASRKSLQNLQENTCA